MTIGEAARLGKARAHGNVFGLLSKNQDALDKFMRLDEDAGRLV